MQGKRITQVAFKSANRFTVSILDPPLVRTNTGYECSVSILVKEIDNFEIAGGLEKYVHRMHSSIKLVFKI